MEKEFQLRIYLSAIKNALTMLMEDVGTQK